MVNRDKLRLADENWGSNQQVVSDSSGNYSGPGSNPTKRIKEILKTNRPDTPARAD
jgi:hypothetical protein